MDPKDPKSVLSALNRPLDAAANKASDAWESYLYGTPQRRILDELAKRERSGDYEPGDGIKNTFFGDAMRRAVRGDYDPIKVLGRAKYSGSDRHQALQAETQRAADRITQPDMSQYQTTPEDAAAEYMQRQLEEARKQPLPPMPDGPSIRASRPGEMYGEGSMSIDEFSEMLANQEKAQRVLGQAFAAGLMTPQQAALMQGLARQAQRGELDRDELKGALDTMNPMAFAAAEAIGQGVGEVASKAAIRALGRFARSDQGQRFSSGVRTGLERVGDATRRFDDAVYRRLHPDRFTDDGTEILMEGTTPRRRMPYGDMADVTPQPAPDAPTAPPDTSTTPTTPTTLTTPSRLPSAATRRTLDVSRAINRGIRPASAEPEADEPTDMYDEVTQPLTRTPDPQERPEVPNQFINSMADDLLAQHANDPTVIAWLDSLTPEQRTEVQTGLPPSEVRPEVESSVDPDTLSGDIGAAAVIDAFSEELTQRINAALDEDAVDPDASPAGTRLEEVLADDGVEEVVEPIRPMMSGRLEYSDAEREAFLAASTGPDGTSAPQDAINTFQRLSGLTETQDSTSAVTDYQRALGSAMIRVANHYQTGEPVFSHNADMLHFLSAPMLDDLGIDAGIRARFTSEGGTTEDTVAAVNQPIVAQAIDEVLRGAEDFAPAAVMSALHESPAPLREKLTILKRFLGSGGPTNTRIVNPDAPLAAPLVQEDILKEPFAAYRNRAARLFDRVFETTRTAGKDAAWDVTDAIQSFEKFTGFPLYRLPKSLNQGNLDFQELKYALNYNSGSAPMTRDELGRNAGQLLFGSDTRLGRVANESVRKRLTSTSSNPIIDRDPMLTATNTAEVPASFLEGLKRLSNGYTTDKNGAPADIAELQGYFKYAVKQSQADTRRAAFNVEGKSDLTHAGTPSYALPISSRASHDDPAAVFSDARVAEIMEVLDIPSKTGQPYLAKMHYLNWTPFGAGEDTPWHSKYVQLPLHNTAQKKTVIDSLTRSLPDMSKFVFDPENFGPAIFAGLNASDDAARMKRSRDLLTGLIHYYRTHNLKLSDADKPSVSDLINWGSKVETLAPRPPVVVQGYDAAERALLEGASRALNVSDVDEPPTYSRLQRALNVLNTKHPERVFATTEDMPVIDRKTGEQRTRVIDGEVVPLVKPGTSARYQFLKALGFAFDKDQQKFLPLSSKGKGVLVSEDEIRTRLEPALQYVERLHPDGFRARNVLSALQQSSGYLPSVIGDQVVDNNVIATTTLLDYYGPGTTNDHMQSNKTRQLIGAGEYKGAKFALDNVHGDSHSYNKYVPEVDQLNNQDATGTRLYYIPTTDRLALARNAWQSMQDFWKTPQVTHRGLRSQQAVRNYVGKEISDLFREATNTRLDRPYASKEAVDAIVENLSSLHTIHHKMTNDLVVGLNNYKVKGRPVTRATGIEDLVFPYSKEEIRHIVNTTLDDYSTPEAIKPMQDMLDKASEVFYAFTSGPSGLGGQSPWGDFSSSHFGRESYIPKPGGFAANDFLGHARFTIGPIENSPVEGKGIVLIEQQFDINQRVADLGAIGGPTTDTKLYRALRRFADVETKLNPLATELRESLAYDIFTNPEMTDFRRRDATQKLTNYAYSLAAEYARKKPNLEQISWRLEGLERLGISKRTLHLVHELAKLTAPIRENFRDYKQQEAMIKELGASIIYGTADRLDARSPTVAEKIVTRILDELAARRPPEQFSVLYDGLTPSSEYVSSDRLPPTFKHFFKYDTGSVPVDPQTGKKSVSTLSSPRAFLSWFENTDAHVDQVSQIPVMTSVNQRLRLIANDMLRQAYLADLDFIALPNAETILTSIGIQFGNSKGVRASYDTFLPSIFAKILNAEVSDFPVVQATVQGEPLKDGHIKIIPLTKEIKDMIRVKMNAEGSALTAGIVEETPNAESFDGSLSGRGGPSALYALPFAMMAGEAARRAMNKEEEPPREN